MVSSQQLVIGWIEYAVSGAILLTATKMIVDRLSQPVDRMNLIAMSLIASAFVPFLLSFMSVPSLRLGLFSNAVERIATVQAESRSLIPRQLPEVPDSSMRRTEPPENFDALSTEQGESQNTVAAITIPTDSALVDSYSTATEPTKNQLSSWFIAASILLLCHGLAIAWFFLQWIIGAVRLKRYFPVRSTTGEIADGTERHSHFDESLHSPDAER